MLHTFMHYTSTYTCSDARIPHLLLIIRLSNYPIIQLCDFPGVKALYPITQTELAVTVTKYLARFDPQGPAAPILLEELSTDPEEVLNVKNDPRRFLKSVMNKTGCKYLLLLVLCVVH
jgi:hypothetical protein